MIETQSILTDSQSTFDLDKIRADFPILHRKIKGHKLVYLDNGASAQKPQQVIDAIDYYYKNTHSNVHRGAHTLSQEATEAYEAARIKLQHFLSAEHSKEIIFTKGTTDAINLNGSRKDVLLIQFYQ